VWIVLTKDERIRYRPAERDALVAARVAAFILTARKMTGSEMARSLVAALPHMRRALERHQRPLIATVDRRGKVRVLGSS
jgi:hypothetical protein